MLAQRICTVRPVKLLDGSLHTAQGARRRPRESSRTKMAENGGSHCCGPGYASPAEAMKAPREKILYTVALYIGTGIQKPDYLATIDADPESSTYSQVIGRLEMPGIGDELHHMGWNACSSCHHDPTKQRRYLIVPGVRSSNLHIVDCIEPKAPRLHKVIEGAEIKSRTN